MTTTASSRTSSQTRTIIGAGALAYLLSLAYWTIAAGKPLGDILFMGLVMGLGFGLLALALTRKTQKITASTTLMSGEGWRLVGFIGFLVVYLAFGTGYGLKALAAAAGLQIHEEIPVLLEKLLVFVALPWLIFFRLSGRSAMGTAFPARLRDAVSGRSLMLLGLFALAFTGIQMVAGQNWGNFTGALTGPSSYLVGLPFAYLWLFLEVGLVEEFCFRAVIQDRLSAILKSDWAGLVAACFLFALAHAPGLYLRVFDGGQSALFTLSYVILILMPASVLFGVLWLRTRNLLLLMAIHATVDMVPNYKGIVSMIGL